MSMASGIGVTSESSRRARRRVASGAAAASGARRRAAVFALACALAVFALLGAAGAAQAGGGTTRTWTGAGLDALWTNPANWDSIAPATGDSLIFPAAVVSGRFDTQNDYAAGTSFGFDLHRRQPVRVHGKPDRPDRRDHDHLRVGHCHLLP